MCQAKREDLERQAEEEAQKLADSQVDEPGEPVFLNVYDLMIMNYTINRLGIGVYHTGVEVYGREYSYAGHYHTENTGLKDSVPRDTSWLHDAIWRERIYIGKTRLTKEEVKAKFEELKPIFLGPSYNVLDRNCNHFTNHFVKILTGKEMPAYVNRIMKIASKVRPCLPGMFKADLRQQTAPPEYESHKYAIPQPRDQPPMIVGPAAAPLKNEAGTLAPNVQTPAPTQTTAATTTATTPTKTATTTTPHPLT